MLITYTGPQRAGEDGLQSGHLQQHDHWIWEARHQGLHLDHAQGGADCLALYLLLCSLGKGRLGGKLKVMQYKQKCNIKLQLNLYILGNKTLCILSLVQR